MKTAAIDVELLQALHDTLQRFIVAHEKSDADTQRDILRQLVEREQAAYQRKIEALGELKTLMREVRAARGVDNCVASLITAFKFAAELRAIAQDELDDRETAETATSAAHQLFEQLEAIVPENSAILLDLLTDPSPAVQASAGAHLLHTVPEQAIPVLEALDRHASGSPSLSAWFALARHKAENGVK